MARWHRQVISRGRGACGGNVTRAPFPHNLNPNMTAATGRGSGPVPEEREQGGSVPEGDHRWGSGTSSEEELDSAPMKGPWLRRVRGRTGDEDLKELNGAR